MKRASDIRVRNIALYWIPIRTRLPIRFGAECVTEVTCIRIRVGITSRDGATAFGWGETPLSVQWMWPSSLSYEVRLNFVQAFCVKIASAWMEAGFCGHSLEIGHRILDETLPVIWHQFNESLPSGHEKMPWLAAIVCNSAFDIAVHDAYGNLHQRSTFTTLNSEFVSDLSHFIVSNSGSQASFDGRYPSDYLSRTPKSEMAAWHLVSASDPLDLDDLDGPLPDDGYPALLSDWIQRDGLQCIKIKLCAKDSQWDYDRIVRVCTIANDGQCQWISLDFNCTVQDPKYVNDILDRLLVEHPRFYQMLLYIEQPFPYDLERHEIDVLSVSARKPVLLDESASDWRMVRLGRQRGWSGVALKTCKSLTGAILMQCWAKAHGMPLMVQDLANPMLALISHVLLAAWSDTLMGVEVNSVQFYPDASQPEAEVHPGLFKRDNGRISLKSMGSTGLGYRIDDIRRKLPEPAFVCGEE